MDETQNDVPFVAFYDMHAVMFVPPDEMADVTTIKDRNKKILMHNTNGDANQLFLK